MFLRRCTLGRSKRRSPWRIRIQWRDQERRTTHWLGRQMLRRRPMRTHCKSKPESWRCQIMPLWGYLSWLKVDWRHSLFSFWSNQLLVFYSSCQQLPGDLWAALHFRPQLQLAVVAWTCDIGLCLRCFCYSRRLRHTEWITSVSNSFHILAFLQYYTAAPTEEVTWLAQF